SDEGITLFNPEDESCVTYYERDGLQSNEFSQHSYLKLSTGEIAFGGIKGFNLFHPAKIFTNNHLPPVILTGFTILNKPVPIGPDSPLKRHITEAKEIHLTHDHYEFSIEFAALDYFYTPGNQYQVKLDGLHKEWKIVPPDRRFVSYTTLDPGDYWFRVKGSNNDGLFNPTGTSVHIFIKPPYWDTWWFQSMVAGFLLLTILVLYRIRTNSIRNRNKRLEEMNVKLNRHISERQQAEDKLKKSERRLRTFLQTAGEGFLEVDREG
ncbi:MAG: histidine kinase, partial [bacterium]|nr:histidine kinase [bacterium]